MSCINKNSKSHTRCRGDDLKILNGNVDIVPYNRFGAMAKYTCEKGYVLYGNATRICQGDEKWSGEIPRCVMKDPDVDKNECRDPPKVHNAVHDGPETQKKYSVGHMLEYRCKEGFMARKESVLRAWCIGGELWVGPNMTCTHAGCPLLPQIDNGHVDILQPNIIGTSAKYTCSTGFFLAGRAIRKCTSEGAWDGREPSCEKVLCNRPPDIPNAYHNAPKGQDSFPAGTVLTYKCEARFRADGQERAMCREDGTWSGPTMFCKVKNRNKDSFKNCGFPGELVNGRREGNRFRFPGKVTYHCNEGYELHGQPVRECQADGVWSGSLPVCKPIRCPELHAPLNGYVTGSGNTYNTVLKFHCSTGFNIVGSSERRCMSNHQWSGQPTRCEGQPGDGNKSITPTKKPKKDSSRKGKKRTKANNGTKSIKNTKDSETNCGLPGPLRNGYLDGHRTTVGAVFFFRCNVRTTFDGPSFSTQCQENGSWSHPPPKCWGQCQVPSILNGSVTHGREGAWVDHETFINFRCREGLVLNDTSHVKCDNGTWSLTPRCIPGSELPVTKEPIFIAGHIPYFAPCSASPPNIDNGRRVYIGWKHGDRAKYMCLQGFRLRGDKYMTCQYGRWKGSRPYCEEIFCPNPGSLTNGKIFKKGHLGNFVFKPYIVTIRHGDRLMYECERGYELLGPTGATCVDGQWSPEDRPLCKQSSHPALQKLWKPIEEGPLNY
ncbi:sushi, von Willebrand factor type A, EGF and pentraxin domain-containing protein 1-like isoform X2 [Octopus sinensis]|uniref:Sushi, von Willebrand factor type A, EGF and pentraxin domain-containing protein 1-like isoform X2 n=1 Tax=Octopus sinensis TaxID=2607531 RepID=A0A6P7SSS0_9MOLL|nr:sushi, von Willebrand factor type A, EGF and pentraxin domain-containing protein 1-like isoform X2 [Octopus sinensis]